MDPTKIVGGGRRDFGMMMTSHEGHYQVTDWLFSTASKTTCT